MVTEDWVLKGTKLIKYYGIGIKTIHIDQWIRIESPETNSCIHGQLLDDRVVKNIQWGELSLFDKCGKIG